MPNKALFSPILKGSDSLYYGSGRLPKIAEGRLVSQSIVDQTKEVFETIRKDLEGVGLTLSNLLKVKIMLVSMEHYAEVNKVYSEIMAEVEIMPARECKAYAGLPLDSLIEVSYIADPGKVA